MSAQEKELTNDQIKTVNHALGIEGLEIGKAKAIQWLTKNTNYFAGAFIFATPQALYFEIIQILQDKQ